MPRLDGSGPRGLGAMTGRGQGRCQSREMGQERRMGQGRRMGLKRHQGQRMQNFCGFRDRRRMHNREFFLEEETTLEMQRDQLLAELDKVNELLESL
ncbi:MAG TPA: DUF5320 domain-containing protein [Erysipelotrichaceae bacterium]|nr:DUF5320 domain-containing protein [Erysipelotrichaceae bacterium]